jgi:hypothetical protein
MILPKKTEDVDAPGFQHCDRAVNILDDTMGVGPYLSFDFGFIDPELNQQLGTFPASLFAGAPANNSVLSALSGLLKNLLFTIAFFLDLDRVNASCLI